MVFVNEHYLKLAAGEIGAESLGDHGIPALFWPPLEAHDANFIWLMGA